MPRLTQLETDLHRVAGGLIAEQTGEPTIVLKREEVKRTKKTKFAKYTYLLKAHPDGHFQWVMGAAPQADTVIPYNSVVLSDSVIELAALLKTTAVDYIKAKPAAT